MRLGTGMYISKINSDIQDIRVSFLFIVQVSKEQRIKGIVFLLPLSFISVRFLLFLIADSWVNLELLQYN